ncbi:MAG TPA: ATP-dependent metallopeptidase FtsH/Yme1/Tma family protein [Crenotrichaceae bacterium]|nr:ATP-dependent metallopeptidase FtsH/Yme1/Tma family protein [Crenotrichaceae bacterium]
MKFIIQFAVTTVLLVMLVAFFSNNSGKGQRGIIKLPYSDFIQDVRNGNVQSVEIESETVRGHLKNGETFITYNPNDSRLIDDLLNADVLINTEPTKKGGFLELILGWLPMLLFLGVFIYFMRRAQSQAGGGSGGLGQLGKSKAKALEEDSISVTFDDVAGVEEAKQDVAEIVDFLKAPERFSKIGGLIPRGILLEGPPGTGKTLLARAIAGEAKVPFFSISGSDFVEMYVGVGAARVRDLFEQAKQKAPCIVFIDEIDAVGRSRGQGVGGGNDEREQTLNQLLVEMDGFEANQGVILIAATNRSDILDKALLRPGRFDRKVTVALPDLIGRHEILKVHAKRIPLADNVELNDIARGTPGFSGAELANLLNEAALFAARRDGEIVEASDIEHAKDKIMMGAERGSHIMTEEEKSLTAYHEAGHAIVGLTVPEQDPIYKVSIMPRGRALGVTLFLPERDTNSASLEKLESQLSTLYGGRIAEALIVGDRQVTTGASNDIERATDLARNMVTRWGMSEILGPSTYGEDNNGPYMGGGGPSKAVSEKTAILIDSEIRKFLDRNYQRAEEILNSNMDKLHAMAAALIKWETIDKWQIDDIMKGIEPREPSLKPLKKKEETTKPEDDESSQSDASSSGSTPVNGPGTVPM